MDLCREDELKVLDDDAAAVVAITEDRFLDEEAMRVYVKPLNPSQITSWGSTGPGCRMLD